MRRAPGFIRLNASRPNMYRVFSLSVVCTVITSLCSMSWSSGTRCAPSCSARSRVAFGSNATTSIPNARAYRATRMPTLPSPTIPSVLPSSSIPVKPLRSHRPAATRL